LSTRGPAVHSFDPRGRRWARSSSILLECQHDHLGPGPLTRAPFRGTDAITAGLLTKAQLRSSVWRRLFRDIYVDARLPDIHLLRCRADGLRLPPGSLVTGRSAAEVRGGVSLWLMIQSRSQPHRETRATAGLAIRVGTVDESERAERFGVPVPTPMHTAWEIARTLPLLEAIVGSTRWREQDA
jgi:hypothetical protein